MNNNLKLIALANEFKATMNHAEEVFNEYMEVAIEQAIEEAINDLSDADKIILLLGLMTGAVEDKIVFDLEKLLAGEDVEEKPIQKPVIMFESDLATLQGDNFVIHILG